MYPEQNPDHFIYLLAEFHLRLLVIRQKSSACNNYLTKRSQPRSSKEKKKILTRAKYVNVFVDINSYSINWFGYIRSRFT